MIADVFVEAVRKATTSAMCCEYGEEEITPSLMQCMQYVFLRGPSPMRAIASGLDVSLSAVSQLVDRLVRKGLMTRHENQFDRRLAEVDLTENGRSLVREMRKRRLAWFESIACEMPAEKRRAFLEGIESFVRIALAKEGDVERACARCGMEHTPQCVINEVKAEKSKGRQETAQ
ncbi:MAG: MarR family winged helix-turn-helix transcriptional regulator [Armatimonadetes bacterium]|nr:MarR family winged helix-turn-helix transcriptional regulator [Armatimonadota bacterium]